ncbi:hypothetical protein BT63DRAFT_450656 [Microthyrium microscopicum]|uniref:Transmembrane protein n=1 Tax=Microthyrium microscopicum TaxID=703497 RepID=A0A6A6UMF7_9PEZI|nr:hypothetical protein BT63DRAFT_450656 [Microthyrium microscopicum]
MSCIFSIMEPVLSIFRSINDFILDTTLGVIWPYVFCSIFDCPVDSFFSVFCLLLIVILFFIVYALAIFPILSFRITCLFFETEPESSEADVDNPTDNTQTTMSDKSEATISSSAQIESKGKTENGITFIIRSIMSTLNMISAIRPSLIFSMLSFRRTIFIPATCVIVTALLVVAVHNSATTELRHHIREANMYIKQQKADINLKNAFIERLVQESRNQHRETQMLLHSNTAFKQSQAARSKELLESLAIVEVASDCQVNKIQKLLEVLAAAEDSTAVQAAKTKELPKSLAVAEATNNRQEEKIQKLSQILLAAVDAEAFQAAIVEELSRSLAAAEATNDSYIDEFLELSNLLAAAEDARILQAAQAEELAESLAVAEETIKCQGGKIRELAGFLAAAEDIKASQAAEIEELSKSLAETMAVLSILKDLGRKSRDIQLKYTS